MAPKRIYGWLKSASITLALELALSSCASQPPPTIPACSTVHHVVLVWMKEPGNPAHRRLIIERTQEFRDIPEVLELQVGPVLPSDRSIVDDSFDVGIVIRFARPEDLRRYIEDPKHQAVVRDVFGPLVGKIQVYDFADWPASINCHLGG